MTARPPIVSAGAVVTRRTARGVEVLLVHRPKYDDWAFPKGKLDPGEHVTAAAVREVAEETGVEIRLGPPLPEQTYVVSNGSLRDKVVHYWLGRPLDHADHDVSRYRPNAEIDGVDWVPLDRAQERLTYPRDRDTLAAALRIRKRSVPLVVLRHAKALPRKGWPRNDRKRPLDERGAVQAQDLVPLLAAYGVGRVVSSSSTRCWATVEPYADTAHVDLETTDALSEEDATPASVSDRVGALVAGGRPAVLCTHRPVLPWVFEALGLEPPRLETGEMVVVHLRRGRVVATERHDPGQVMPLDPFEE